MSSVTQPLRVAFVGNFAAKKGSQVLAAVIKSLDKHCLWHIFGYVGDKDTFQELKPWLVASSAYADDELSGLLSQHKIDLVLVLSIWPETFSKTFFEATKLGYPVLAFRIGFPAEIFPEWPLFVDLEAGATGVIKVLSGLTKSKLNEYQQQFPPTRFFQEYQHLAEVKYQVVDKLLAAELE